MECRSLSDASNVIGVSAQTKREWKVHCRREQCDPFLIIGDAPHSILAKLNNSDAVTYLTDRGQRGFNALWIELLCDSYTFGFGNEGTPNYGRDVNGNNPFSATLQEAITI